MRRTAAFLLSAAIASCTQAPAPQRPRSTVDAGANPAPPAPPRMQRLNGPAQSTEALRAYLWRLTDARDRDDARITDVLDKPGLPISLQFDEKRVRVSNTCNRMGGEYRYIQTDQVEVQQVQQTLMACADARLMAAESRIGRMVSEAALLTVEKSRSPRLRLTTLEGERLWFEGVPLTGTPRG